MFSILESSAGSKRPAEEVTETEFSSEKKIRPTPIDKTTYPDKKTAEKALKEALKLKATAPKKKSAFVRFKGVLLKDAKERGDKEVCDNITSKAKTAWSTVKQTDPELMEVMLNTPTTSTQASEELYKNLKLKKIAIEEEANELSKFQEATDKFKDAYLEPAISILKFVNEEAIDQTNVDRCERQAREILDRANKTWGDEHVPVELLESYGDALMKIESFKKEQEVFNLVEKLRGASDELLTEHAKQHCKMLESVKELEKVRAIEQSLRKERDEEQQKTLSHAHKVKSEICKELKKQMVYTGSGLKYSAKKITYKRIGVTAKLFSAAFGVPEGTKTFEFPGSDVGYKSLRYSILECVSNVKVRLAGDSLTASTSYKIV